MPQKLLESDSDSDSELQIKINDNYEPTFERSPPITPRSPFSSVVRAHLPNHEKTSVKIKAGQSLREALKKAMAIRKLTPEICDVYSLKSRLRIDWDQDIRTLEGHEIIVEARASPIRTSISHNFVRLTAIFLLKPYLKSILIIQVLIVYLFLLQVRKTFFSLAFCECCHRFLWHGFRCQTCNFRFHQRCANLVPSLCQPLSVESSSYYSHLLALNDPYKPNSLSGPYFKSPSQSQRASSSSSDPEYQHTFHQLRGPYIGQESRKIVSNFSQRERSTSAPNVYLVNQNNQSLDDFVYKYPTHSSSSGMYY